MGIVGIQLGKGHRVRTVMGIKYEETNRVSKCLSITAEV